MAKALSAVTRDRERPDRRVRRARLRMDALATTAGVEIAGALSGKEADFHRLDKLAKEADAIAQGIGAAPTRDDAVSRDLGRELAFASGAAHGVSATLRAFAREGDPIPAGPDASSARATLEKACESLSSSLAALDLDEAWTTVVRSKRKAASFGDLAGAAYSEGMALALQQLTAAFRSNLEQSITSALFRPELDRDQQLLLVLLFVAVARPTQNRLLAVLGPDFADAFDKLDREGDLACAKPGVDPPRRVTEKGSRTARRILSGA